ncbi:HNH endonuclease [Streptomyces sp. NPDC021969]|uniref:HNH endonuclease n=1 Tax=unclassified Streptomyces TaxID=2593676 RepID=UPI0033DF8327
MKCNVTNSENVQCERDAKTNGLCPGHNTRLLRKGDVLADIPLRTYTKATTFEAPKFGHGSTDEEKFFSLVNRTANHWFWDGGITKSTGLGMYSLEGVPKTAGRIAWELAFGPLPEGTRIKHACGEHLCVRLSHLAVIHLDGTPYVDWSTEELVELEVAA